MSSRDPLVLFHPLGTSARLWDDVRPLLEPHHAPIALTALGHRGGAVPSHRPVTVRDLVDDAERALDERGLDRVDLVGNSIGGWMAIELARRGRARTVCAFSPAGAWRAGTSEQTDGVRQIRNAIRAARLGRSLPMPLLMRSGAVRRLVFRDVARHGERLTADQAMEATRDLLACSVADELLRTDEEIEPLDPLSCPITLVWSREDAICPLETNGALARERLPAARFIVIDDVGHLPMIDDPASVAEAIRGACEARVLSAA